MSKQTKTKQPKVVSKTYDPIGLIFLGGGRNGLSGCYMKYQERTLVQDENGYREIIKVVSGKQLRAYPNHSDLNGTKKQKQQSRKYFKPELLPQMVALPTLLQPLQEMCAELDKEWQEKT